MSEDSCEELEILDKTLTGSGTGLYDMLAEDLTNLPRERWKLSWLVCLFSNVIQPRVTREKEPQVEICLVQIGLWPCL